MSKLLASVNSLAEAQLVLNIGVDIIDLKQPAQGALGALDLNSVTGIVSSVSGKCPVSATVGDLPMHPEIVFNAVKAMSQTGVDYIKIGFFPGGDWLASVKHLTVLTAQGHALIAVLFADTQPDFTFLHALKTAGFKGVMIDTMDKRLGSLTQILPKNDLITFIRHAKKLDLMSGLAGSLRLEDITGLLPLDADYLGFRGALCEQQQRTASLSASAIRAIKHALRP
ncbi:MAG: (5-formylfuran-3-yl)methyl phosphate synthase [Methylococcales bacterium]